MVIVYFVLNSNQLHEIEFSVCMCVFVGGGGVIHYMGINSRFTKRKKCKLQNSKYFHDFAIAQCK